MDITEVEKMINDTVNLTVIRLKMAGLMKDDRKSAYQKTEELLRNYTEFQLSDTPAAKKIVQKIDEALDSIDDPYIDTIRMIYFEEQTREDCAEYFDCTVTTISRKKNKIVNRLKSILFSDDVIYELFL